MDMSGAVYIRHGGAIYIRHGGAGEIRHGVGCLSMTKQVKSHRSFSNPQTGGHTIGAAAQGPNR